MRRRGWLDSGRFLDMLGATSLIPGPNSTEMAMHVGFVRAGGRGLVVAGAAFILPAALLTGVLAWAYVRFGSLPSVAPLLAGIKPAVLAVIVGALFRLGRVATRTPALAALAALAGVAVLAGLNEVLVLVATGVLGGAALWTAGRQAPTSLAVIPWAVGSAGASAVVTSGALSTLSAGVPLWKLALFFLKVGAVLYGSGYVLIAFLEGELVEGLGWLTHGQLLDAIAIGQFTPGPVLTTATFIGYLVAGLPGAVVATATASHSGAPMGGCAARLGERGGGRIDGCGYPHADRRRPHGVAGLGYRGVGGRSESSLRRRPDMAGDRWGNRGLGVGLRKLFASARFQPFH